MRTVIITSPKCSACEKLKKKHPDVPTIDITAYGPLSYILQVLTGKSDIRTPLVVVITEGNGRESDNLLRFDKKRKEKE